MEANGGEQKVQMEAFLSVCVSCNFYTQATLCPGNNYTRADETLIHKLLNVHRHCVTAHSTPAHVCRAHTLL